MDSKTDDVENKKVFKVLTIDGGGIKGLYSARILQHFEEHFNCKIGDYFDMICGTSTGGLIALGLSRGISATDLVKFYEEDGPNIFPSSNNILSRGYRWARQTFFFGKYNDKKLKRALQKILGEAIMADCNNVLCIPSYTVTEGRTWVFKYGNPKLRRDDNTKCVDVALATSAAPTYFPLAELESYDHQQFVDGGIWANNPTLIGYFEALDCYVGNDKEFTQLNILSLSSLTLNGGKKIGRRRFRSFIGWKADLFDAAMTGQSLFADHFMAKIQNHTNIMVKYTRIPTAEIALDHQSLIQLDVATKEAIRLIKSKGNTQGEIYKKKPEIAEFFKEVKQYKIQ